MFEFILDDGTGGVAFSRNGVFNTFKLLENNAQRVQLNNSDFRQESVITGATPTIPATGSTRSDLTLTIGRSSQYTYGSSMWREYGFSNFPYGSDLGGTYGSITPSQTFIYDIESTYSIRPGGGESHVASVVFFRSIPAGKVPRNLYVDGSAYSLSQRSSSAPDHYDISGFTMDRTDWLRNQTHQINIEFTDGSFLFVSGGSPEIPGNPGSVTAVRYSYIFPPNNLVFENLQGLTGIKFDFSDIQSGRPVVTKTKFLSTDFNVTDSGSDTLLEFTDAGLRKLANGDNLVIGHVVPEDLVSNELPSTTSSDLQAEIDELRRLIGAGNQNPTPGTGGSTTFLGLTDTPSSFEVGKILQATRTGLNWIDLPTGGGGVPQDQVGDVLLTEDGDILTTEDGDALVLQ